MCLVSPRYSNSFDSDFARVISRKFEHGRFLIVGGDAGKLESQFAEAKREAEVWSYDDVASKLRRGEWTGRFETALWFYSSEENQDDIIAEALASCADAVVLLPGPGADAGRRRPQLVQCFGRFGFVPDYECGLIELDPGAVCLRGQRGEAAGEHALAIEKALARITNQLSALQRTLQIREAELKEAHRHVAGLEEKLLKLKEYRRELKLLKKERRLLRSSAERRVGQVLLAPYRIPEKLVKTVWKKVRKPKSATASEYQKWFERHRASVQDLERMRDEARKFALRPLISVITPVFDTPVQWLEEAVQSILSQVYENWELVLVDDGSTNNELLYLLPRLAARDQRIVVASLGKHGGISAASNHGLGLARGEWVAFLDHDDLLEPDALFQNASVLQKDSCVDLIYSDEDKLTEDGLGSPILKPDWSPDFFLSCNYLCHLIFLRRQLICDVGGFRSDLDGSQDYDLLLRIIERTDRVVHIPRVLYHWRRSPSSSADSVRQKPGQLEASRLAIEGHLQRRRELAHVTVDWRTHVFHVRRELLEAKKISIVIQSAGHAEQLKRCIERLTARTSYPSYEIIIVRQGNEPLAQLPGRVVRAPDASSVAALNNLAVQQTDNSWLLFLDAGVEPIQDDWLTIMAEHVQRPEVGAVGARLVNSNGTIEHAGIVLGVNGIAQPAFGGFPAEDPGVNRQLQMVRNYSAVSGACLLVRREVFQEVGGFDSTLSEAFADIDFCLKIRRAGYLIVYTPLAKLYWEAPVPDKIDLSGEAIMRERWPDVLAGDPFYNPNLSRERADFSLGG